MSKTIKSIKSIDSSVPHKNNKGFFIVTLTDGDDNNVLLKVKWSKEFFKKEDVQDSLRRMPKSESIKTKDIPVSKSFGREFYKLYLKIPVSELPDRFLVPRDLYPDKPNRPAVGHLNEKEFYKAVIGI